MTQERKTFLPILPNDVCQTYELLHSKGLVAFPLPAGVHERVSAVVSSITETYFGHEIYASNAEKAVAYLYLLIKDHPFTDGNKRTASLIFAMACQINGLVPRFGDGNPTLDELAVFVEKVRDPDHHKVIRLIADVLFSTP